MVNQDHLVILYKRHLSLSKASQSTIDSATQIPTTRNDLLEYYTAILEGTVACPEWAKPLPVEPSEGIVVITLSDVMRQNVRTPSEDIFEREKALAVLLAEEIVHVNTHHWEKDWPERARETLYLGVVCNDVFAWGVADSESCHIDDIETVYRNWVKDPDYGHEIWAIVKRKEMPQRPVEDAIRKQGIWDLDALREEHELKPNFYDGMSLTSALQKYNLYSEWEKKRGKEPRPFDIKWWEGWYEYILENPDWNSEEFKKENERLLSAWKQENRYV